MDFLYLLLAFVIIYILIKYVIPAILAISGVAAIVVAIVATGVGFYHAVKNYITAIQEEMDFRNWTWTTGGEPARRSYFFGPGYQQLGDTVKKAFALNAVSIDSIKSTAESIKGDGDGIWHIVRSVGAVIYIFFGYICIYVIGMILCGALALIHGAVTTAVMIVNYMIFCIVWLLDRLYLVKNEIHSDCPIHHERYLIPAFACPDCGEIHFKLVPGPYGIWHHRCVCGCIIPSTFLSGRSKLQALCPKCKSSIVASDARPIVFQLVGGTGSGKTVFLSAFFHKFIELLSKTKLVQYTIPDLNEPYFRDMETWYHGAYCPSTAELNSQMYPVLIDSPLPVKRQFSIYDIAGEMFNSGIADSVLTQHQFHYCDGLLFLLDPFSSGKLRMDRINMGESLEGFSEIATEDVVSNFINYLIRTGNKKVNTRCSIPISIMIAKADIKEVKRVIGPAKLNSVLRNNPDKYANYAEARDGECRQFLIDIGLGQTVTNLEVQFSNLHYFPVSAMGHAPDGTEYESWGVLEPVEWMIRLTDPELANLILS